MLAVIHIRISAFPAVPPRCASVSCARRFLQAAVGVLFGRVGPRSGRRCVCGCRSAKGLSGPEAGGAWAAPAGIDSVSGIGRFGFFAWKQNPNAAGASCMIALVRPFCLTTQRRAMLRQAGRSASVSGRCSGILLGKQDLAGRFSAAYSICSRRRCGRDCSRRPIGECLALRSFSVRRRVLRFCGLRVPKRGLAAAHEKGRINVRPCVLLRCLFRVFRPPPIRTRGSRGVRPAKSACR